MRGNILLWSRAVVPLKNRKCYNKWTEVIWRRPHRIPFFPSRRRGIETPSSTKCLGPKSLHPIAIGRRSAQPFFQGADRQTDFASDSHADRHTRHGNIGRKSPHGSACGLKRSLLCARRNILGKTSCNLVCICLVKRRTE